MSKKTIKMIYAKSQNGVIGNKGKIPWNHPEDMAHFKELTKDGTVIMGRKTWDSLPPKFRPLPGRENIIITRNKQFEADNAIVVNSVTEAILNASRETVWVIGGEEIYKQALQFVSEIHVTVIHEDYEGDAYAPILYGWRSKSQETVFKKWFNERIPVLTFVTLVKPELE